MKVKNILADGREIENLQGFIITKAAAPEIYNIAKRKLKERKEAQHD